MANRLGNNGGRSYDFLYQPVKIDCNFIVDAANGNGLGIRSLKGAGVRNVYMHTSATPAAGNPNPAVGYALIQLREGYFKYAGGFSGFVSPLSGSSLAINATALTPNAPYVIVSVGSGSAGTVTIAPVADTAGSLASTYFVLYDSYGNKYIVWFSVAGVGSAPIGVSGTLVQQSIASGATAAQVGAALVTTLSNLMANQPGNSQAPSGVNSFTATGTTTVMIVNTLSVPFPGGPADGAIPTGFTFAVTKDQTNTQNWQAVGLPKGIVPSVGAAFVASASGYSSRGGSSGLVQAPSVSGILSTEVVGDPNQTIQPVAMGGSPHVGGWIMIQFLAPTLSTNAYGQPMIPTAPAAGSVASLSFFMESKSILTAGE